LRMYFVQLRIAPQNPKTPAIKNNFLMASFQQYSALSAISKR